MMQHERRRVVRNPKRSRFNGTDESGPISILYNLLASAFEQRYTAAALSVQEYSRSLRTAARTTL